MIQRQLDTEFLGNADGSQNIIGTVSMSLQRKLALNDGDHGFQLHVKGRILSGLLVLQITLGLEQQLPKQSGGAHSGHGTLLSALTVAALGILAEGALHGDGILDDHIVHTLAVELDGDKRAADHVGTAGTGAGCGDAAADGVIERFVHGIDRINGTQLRGNGINDFVVVHAFPTHGLVVKSDVAMGIHTAGSHQTTLSIDDLSALGSGDLLRNGDNLAVITDENAAAGKIAACHRFDVTVFDQ